MVINLRGVSPFKLKYTKKPYKIDFLTLKLVKNRFFDKICQNTSTRNKFWDQAPLER